MRIELKNDNIFSETLLEIKKLIEGTRWQGQVWLVGGGVRDLIMGKELHDIDLVVTQPNGGINFAEWMCKETDCYKYNSNPVIFPTYGTAKFNIRSIHKLSNVDIECVQTRKEQYKDKNSRNPSTVYGNMIEDANRRDLTINALYLNLTSFVVADPTGKGLNDIENHVIRTTSDPDVIFDDDPLRMLRVIRFASRFGWGIEKDTWLGIVKNAHRISIISQERVTDELSKIMACDKPSLGLNRIWHSGLMRLVLPEIHALIGVTQGEQHFGDVYEHTMAVVDNCVNDTMTRWACLYHDVAKPETRVAIDGKVTFHAHESMSALTATAILKRMKFANSDIRNISMAIRQHMKFKQFKDNCPSKKSLRHMLAEIGDNVEMCLNLIDADNKSHSEKWCAPNQIKLARVAIKSLTDNNSKPINQIPITGKDIMEKFGLSSSPTIGFLLKLARNIYLDNPNTTKEECYRQLELKLAV